MKIKKARVLHTKFGTATIDKKGYYRIKSTKENNRNKALHRLIYEDFYKITIPNGFVIHHKNGIKTDNCILNLQLLSKAEHHSLHNAGKVLLDKTKQRISKSKTGKKIKPFTQDHKNNLGISLSKKSSTTGYYRVYKQKDSTCRQGFRYCYSYREDGKVKSIKSVDLKKLEEKVKAKGLKWIKFN